MTHTATPSGPSVGRILRSLVLPLTALGVVPALLLWGEPGDRLDPVGDPARGVAGALLLGCGLGLLGWTVSLFVRLGRGTLAPWDPTRQLVVVGPYAHVRNPMISGVWLGLLGEALLFGSWRVAAWAAAFLVINHAWFVLYEEPGLVRRFGGAYERYRREVPRWIPRWRGWTPPPTADG
jgi:protein-S-isoprenylcysteine O-methyltransferase Ste14